MTENQTTIRVSKPLHEELSVYKYRNKYSSFDEMLRNEIEIENLE